MAVDAGDEHFLFLDLLEQAGDVFLLLVLLSVVLSISGPFSMSATTSDRDSDKTSVLLHELDESSWDDLNFLKAF